jgi:hypothetical protein
MKTLMKVRDKLFITVVHSSKMAILTGHHALFISEKRTYNGLPDFMTKVAQEELSKLDASITECNILYLPQVFHSSTPDNHALLGHTIKYRVI